MFCSNCGTETSPNASFCAKCGSPLATDLGPRAFSPSRRQHHDVEPPQYAANGPLGSVGEAASAHLQDQGRWFPLRLAAGSYGLAKTFWIYGILIWMTYVVVETLLVMSKGTQAHTIAIGIPFVFIAYLFVLIPGIWNAANKHQGSKLFAILAKIVCIFWILQLASVVVRIVEVMYA